MCDVGKWWEVGALNEYSCVNYIVGFICEKYASNIFSSRHLLAPPEIQVAGFLGARDNLTQEYEANDTHVLLMPPYQFHIPYVFGCANLLKRRNTQMRRRCALRRYINRIYTRLSHGSTAERWKGGGGLVWALCLVRVE